MLIAAIRLLFALSVLGMVWWAFLWPVVIPVEPDNRLFYIGSITTLLLFFACIIALLFHRLSSPGQRGH